MSADVARCLRAAWQLYQKDQRRVEAAGRGRSGKHGAKSGSKRAAQPQPPPLMRSVEQIISFAGGGCCVAVSGQWLHPATGGDLAACPPATLSQSDASSPVSLHLPAAAAPFSSPAGSPQPAAGALASCARAIEDSMGLQPGAQLPLATLLERLPSDPPVTGEQRREGEGFHGRGRPGQGRTGPCQVLPLLRHLLRLQQLHALAGHLMPAAPHLLPPGPGLPWAADNVEVYKVPDSDPREKLRCAAPPACLPACPLGLSSRPARPPACLAPPASRLAAGLADAASQRANLARQPNHASS